MSRSYKNSPVVTCAKNSRGKRDAARATRHSSKALAQEAAALVNTLSTTEIVYTAKEYSAAANGAAYRREFSSWDICDYKSYWPEGGDKARRK